MKVMTMSALMHLWSTKCWLNSTYKCIWPFHLLFNCFQRNHRWSGQWKPKLQRFVLPETCIHLSAAAHYLMYWCCHAGGSGWASLVQHVLTLTACWKKAPVCFSTETLGVRKLIGSGFSVPAATSRADLDLCPRASPWRSNASAPFGDYRRTRASTVCFLDWYQIISYLGDILFHPHVF